MGDTALNQPEAYAETARLLHVSERNTVRPLGECATDWYPKRGIEGTYLALMKSWYGGPGRSHLYYHSHGKK